MGEPRVRGACYPPCAERFIAICNEEFGPAKTLGGWVFRDGPVRRVSWQVRYTCEDAALHAGEPYVWVTCPYCGGDLGPPPDDEGLEGETGG